MGFIIFDKKIPNLNQILFKRLNLFGKKYAAHKKYMLNIKSNKER